MTTSRQRMATGGFGEASAARHLVEQGMVVLDRNWRCEQGEIDLVLRDGEVLVFCEVKTRASAAYGTPLEAVTATTLSILASRSSSRVAICFSARASTTPLTPATPSSFVITTTAIAPRTRASAA